MRLAHRAAGAREDVARVRAHLCARCASTAEVAPFFTDCRRASRPRIWSIVALRRLDRGRARRRSGGPAILVPLPHRARPRPGRQCRRAGSGRRPQSAAPGRLYARRGWPPRSPRLPQRRNNSAAMAAAARAQGAADAAGAARRSGGRTADGRRQAAVTACRACAMKLPRRHRPRALRRHRRHRHERHRRGAAQSRLHGAGLRRPDSANIERLRELGAEDLRRPRGRQSRRAPRSWSFRPAIKPDNPELVAARARACRWCAGPRCWPS